MLHPREVTYNGGKVQNWYIGADVFYGALAECFCRVIDESSTHDDDHISVVDIDEASASFHIDEECVDEQLLKQGLRAYIVAAAMSTIRSGKLGPNTAAGMTFDSLNEVKSMVAPVTSMLIHPSADLDEHFNIKEIIARWWNGEGGMPGEGVFNDLEVRRQVWISEYESYRKSATKITQEYGDRFVLLKRQFGTRLKR